VDLLFYLNISDERNDSLKNRRIGLGSPRDSLALTKHDSFMVIIRIAIMLMPPEETATPETTGGISIMAILMMTIKESCFVNANESLGEPNPIRLFFNESFRSSLMLR
jgi:hypothetical protein